MDYFRVKSDLRFMKGFLVSVRLLWEFEARASKQINWSGRIGTPSEAKALVQSVAQKMEGEGYEEQRENVARKIPQAMEIARRYRVPIDLQSFPPAVVGGPVIPVNMFRAILTDDSWGRIPNQRVLDAINETIGQLEADKKREFRRLVNPAWWVFEAFKFVIRIPFMLISLSGFDVNKVEDHLLAKVFKLAEIAFIVFVLLRLGFERTKILEAVVGLFGK